MKATSIPPPSLTVRTTDTFNRSSSNSAVNASRARFSIPEGTRHQSLTLRSPAPTVLPFRKIDVLAHLRSRSHNSWIGIGHRRKFYIKRGQINRIADSARCILAPCHHHCIDTSVPKTRIIGTTHFRFNTWPNGIGNGTDAVRHDEAGPVILSASKDFTRPSPQA